MLLRRIPCLETCQTSAKQTETTQCSGFSNKCYVWKCQQAPRVTRLPPPGGGSLVPLPLLIPGSSQLSRQIGGDNSIWELGDLYFLNPAQNILFYSSPHLLVCGALSTGIAEQYSLSTVPCYLTLLGIQSQAHSSVIFSYSVAQDLLGQNFVWFSFHQDNPLTLDCTLSPPNSLFSFPGPKCSQAICCPWKPCCVGQIGNIFHFHNSDLISVVWLAETPNIRAMRLFLSPVHCVVNLFMILQ